MTREEAFRLARTYLTQENQPYLLALDHLWTLNSLTEYTACWYVDFRYQQPPQVGNGVPGFIIDKREQQIRVISWQELYELNKKELFQ